MNWIFFALISAFAASLMPIFGKLGLKNVDPILAATIRAIIMVPFLFLTSLLLKKFENFSFNTLASKDWLLIILSSIAGVLSWVFYFMALKYGPVSKVAVIDRLSLIFVIILSVLILGEEFGWQIALGTILVVLGVILIILK